MSNYNLRPRKIYRSESSSLEETETEEEVTETEEEETETESTISDLIFDETEQLPEMADQQANAFPNLLALSYKPPTFDGTRPDTARRWLRNFNRYADLAGIEENDRCTLMGLMLTGSAEKWFDNLPAAARNNYEQLTNNFNQQFVNVETTRMQRQMQALTRIQQSGETVDEYFVDVCNKLDEHNFDPDFKLTLIINGLRSDIKGLVIQHQPFNDVNDLLNKARHIEASVKATQVNPYVSPTIPVLATTTKEEMFATTGDLLKLEKSIVDKVVDRLQKTKIKDDSEHQQPRQFPSRGYQNGAENNLPRCYVCSSTKHFRRDCPFEERYYRSPIRSSNERSSAQQLFRGRGNFRGNTRGSRVYNNTSFRGGRPFSNSSFQGN